MRDLFTNEYRILSAGQASSGVAKDCLTLRVVKGRAWVTVEGGLEDHWLSEGNTLQAKPGFLTVIEADPDHGDVEFSIERPQSLGARLATQVLSAAQRRFSHHPANNARAGKTVQTCTQQ
jgi:hypothetical protein